MCMNMVAGIAMDYFIASIQMQGRVASGTSSMESRAK